MTTFGHAVHITTVHAYPDVRIFYKECMSIAKAGHQVTLITQADQECLVDGIKIIPLLAPKNRLDRMSRTLYHALRLALREKATIYHFHDPELILVGVVLKLLGKKVVYDVHENVPEDIKVKKYLPKYLRSILAFLINCLELASAKLFDAIVTVTPKIAERFPKEKTFLVRNFPDVHEFHDDAQTLYQERECNVLYAGGINEIRGAKQMVGALNLLPASVRVKLLLAGKFDSLHLHQQLMSHSGWKNVDYWGLVNREKLKTAFAMSKIGWVLFHPDNNHLYAYPNKLFEYMSAGLPVIASDFPLWREIVEKSNCGLLVNPLDEQAIADAIAYLIAHPEEAKQMGENGRNAVIRNYSWEAEAKTLLLAYQKLLSSKANVTCVE